jgi:hypothetical protein
VALHTERLVGRANEMSSLDEVLAELELGCAAAL